jgi:hypothetical protein
LGPHLGRIGPTEFVLPYLAPVRYKHKININIREGNIMYNILYNMENKIKNSYCLVIGLWLKYDSLFFLWNDMTCKNL